MPHPPPWPGRPGNAQDFDQFWLVRGLPPNPFPDDAYDYGSDPQFGPPGTRWVFSLEALYNRQTAPGVSQGTKFAIERLFKKLAVKLPPAGSTSWATPLAAAPPAVPVEVEFGMPMNWVRAQVVAALGTDEEVVHVLNFRHSTVENQSIDAAQLKVLTNQIRDAWAAFMTESTLFFPQQLVYKEVRGSLLTQSAPATKPTWPLPTQVSPFAAGVKGTSSGQPLPYEVALGLSLNTNFRGTSRFRGRTYLGPLPVGIMSVDGQFTAAQVEAIGASFGTKFLAGVETASDYEAHVISQKYGTSAKITGIRVGKTPDSQRRRRRDRPELYTQVWGTAVGAL